jgi:hypothetical protein
MFHNIEYLKMCLSEYLTVVVTLEYFIYYEWISWKTKCDDGVFPFWVAPHFQKTDFTFFPSAI